MGDRFECRFEIKVYSVEALRTVEHRCPIKLGVEQLESRAEPGPVGKLSIGDQSLRVRVVVDLIYTTSTALPLFADESTEFVNLNKESLVQRPFL